MTDVGSPRYKSVPNRVTLQSASSVKTGGHYPKSRSGEQASCSPSPGIDQSSATAEVLFYSHNNADSQTQSTDDTNTSVVRIGSPSQVAVITDAMDDNDGDLHTMDLDSEIQSFMRGKRSDKWSDRSKKRRNWKPLQSTFALLSTYDKALSHRIHQLCLGYMDYLFAPGAFCFGSRCMFCTIWTAILLVKVSGFLFTGFACLFTVGITQSLKRYHQRMRPDISSIRPRKIDFRTHLTNFSFPSGDTAQAAAYGTSLFLMKRQPVWLVLIPLTAWGRVYYGCHFIGDCVWGACIGIMVVCTMWFTVPLSSMNALEDAVVHFVLNVVLHS